MIKQLQLPHKGFQKNLLLPAVLLHGQGEQVRDKGRNPVNLLDHAVAQHLIPRPLHPALENLNAGTDSCNGIFDLVGQGGGHSAGVIVHIFQEQLKGSSQLSDLVPAPHGVKPVGPVAAPVFIDLMAGPAHGPDGEGDVVGDKNAGLNDNDKRRNRPDHHIGLAL